MLISNQDTGPWGGTMTLARFVWIGLMFVSCAAPITTRKQVAQGGTDHSVVAPRNSVGIVLGNREFNADFEPLEDQQVFGVETVIAHTSENLFEFGFVGSSENEDVFVSGVGILDYEVSSNEIYAGMRVSTGDAQFRPYLGVGLTRIEVEAALNDGILELSASDSAVGLYAHAGIQASLNEHIWVGFDVRSVFGTDMELSGIETDADYFQFAGMLGFWF